MNHALILAGGNGERMNMGALPKQYIMVNEQPIINYSLSTFEKHPMIDKITIVADEVWHGFLDSWIGNSNVTKY